MKIPVNKILLYDSGCGEPIAWIEDGEYNELSHEEAIIKYGKVSKENLGPKGGFRNRHYGVKMFLTNLEKFYRL